MVTSLKSIPVPILITIPLTYSNRTSSNKSDGLQHAAYVVPKHAYNIVLTRQLQDPACRRVGCRLKTRVMSKHLSIGLVPSHDMVLQRVPIIELAHFVCASLQVTVITSDIRFAGTTADVFAEFEGEAGKFGPVALESSASNFERARRDDFFLRAVDIGSILKVRIWHANNALTGSDWHLQVRSYRLPLSTEGPL